MRKTKKYDYNFEYGTVLEHRRVQKHIHTSGEEAGSGKVYVPHGLFDRTWYTYLRGVVTECRVLEIGKSRMKVCGGHEGDYVRLVTPQGEETQYELYRRFSLYESYHDAVYQTRPTYAHILPFAQDATFIMYDEISLPDNLREQGFNSFEIKGYLNYLYIYGYQYTHGCLSRDTLYSTMWMDKEGLHLDVELPAGVFKTKEEAYAANMPQLLTFADETEAQRAQNSAEQRRKDFVAYMAQRCPGCERGIDWSLFKPKETDAENCVTQILRWVSKNATRA